MRATIGVAVVAGLLASAASADTPQFYSAQELHASCQQEWAGGGWCGGFVSGVLVALKATTSSVAERLCVPGTVTVDQMAAVVRSYIETHSGSWNQPAWSVVTSAALEAFPCAQ